MVPGDARVQTSPVSPAFVRLKKRAAQKQEIG